MNVMNDLDREKMTVLAEISKKTQTAVVDRSVYKELNLLLSKLSLQNCFFDAVQFGEEYSIRSLLDSVIDEDDGVPYETPEYIKSLNSYTGDFCSYKLVSPEMESDLFLRIGAIKQHLIDIKARAAKDQINQQDISNAKQLVCCYFTYRNILIRANVRLVMSLAKSYISPRMSFDELLSVGIEALPLCVDRFNVLLGYRFSTFATTCVRRQMLRYVQKQQKLSLAEDIGPEVLVSVPDSSQGGFSDDPNVVLNLIEALLNQLNARERDVLENRFGIKGQKQTLRVIAERLGVSHQRVRQIETHALNKLNLLAKSSEYADALMPIAG